MKYKTLIFDTEDDFLQELHKYDEDRSVIVDIFCPYPVDLPFTLGSKSNIPLTGLIGGLSGFILALFFQIWISTYLYPMNFGGKPFLTMPTYMIVSFECAILCAVLTMVTVFLVKNKNRTGRLKKSNFSNDQFAIMLKSNHE